MGADAKGMLNMKSGGGKSSVVKSGTAPKGESGKLIGGPQKQYKNKSIGTTRFDVTDRSLTRGRRV